MRILKNVFIRIVPFDIFILINKQFNTVSKIQRKLHLGIGHKKTMDRFSELWYKEKIGREQIIKLTDKGKQVQNLMLELKFMFEEIDEVLK